MDVEGQREGLGDEGTSWGVYEGKHDIESVSGESTNAKGANCREVVA